MAAVAPTGLASVRDAYQQWLRSDRWNVAVGAATWHLFYTDVFSHLWFLCFLCWMVAGFAGIALLAGRSSGRAPDALPMHESTVFRFGQPSDAVFRVALCLIPLTLLPQWLMGSSPLQFGPDTSSGLLPQPHLLFYYGLFFGFGSLLFESERFGRTIGIRWWIYLGLGLFAAFPAWRYSIGNHAVGAIAQVVYAWVVSIGLIGLFRRFMSRPSRTVRYVSDSSYWLYLVHLPLVIALQSWTRDWPASALVKFIGVNVASVALLLISYHCLVRPTWIGVLLNGRRERRTSDEPAAPQFSQPAL
jgi:peptidoglycan/LPS O-acetylase OafA/YrhL